LRTRLLSDREAEVVRAFLEEGLLLSGIRTLAWRARKFLPIVLEEARLLERFLQEYEKHASKRVK